jgi:hypothetical protein
MFRAGQMTHPIGKSIFVFAGGVTRSFEEFGRAFPLKEAKPDNRKGRDFLSRLRGHINVEGLWPVGRDGNRIADPGGNLFSNPGFGRYVMRRAILLRELLKQRARTIFRGVEGAEEANIDERVVKAFLRESEFRHGIRSIEAVIRMSSVAPGGRFTPECLPTKRQIEMHVSPKFYDRAFGLEAVD